MRRLLIAAAGAGLLSLVFVASASAYWSYDGVCQIHGNPPFVSGGYMYAEGVVNNCLSGPELYEGATDRLNLMETCLQTWNGNTRQWYSSNCRFDGPIGQVARERLPSWGKAVHCGIGRRTWTWASLSDDGHTQSKAQVSAWWKPC